LPCVSILPTTGFPPGMPFTNHSIALPSLDMAVKCRVPPDTTAADSGVREMFATCFGELPHPQVITKNNRPSRGTSFFIFLMQSHLTYSKVHNSATHRPITQCRTLTKSCTKFGIVATKAKIFNPLFNRVSNNSDHVLRPRADDSKGTPGQRLKKRMRGESILRRVSVAETQTGLEAHWSLRHSYFHNV
jgi:hypothetical protein